MGQGFDRKKRGAAASNGNDIRLLIREAGPLPPSDRNLCPKPLHALPGVP